MNDTEENNDIEENNTIEKIVEKYPTLPELINAAICYDGNKVSHAGINTNQIPKSSLILKSVVIVESAL